MSFLPSVLLLFSLAYLLLLARVTKGQQTPANKVLTAFLFVSLAWNLAAFVTFNNFPDFFGNSNLRDELIITAMLLSFAIYHHFIRVYTGKPGKALRYCCYAGVSAAAAYISMSYWGTGIPGAGAVLQFEQEFRSFFLPAVILLTIVLSMAVLFR